MKRIQFLGLGLWVGTVALGSPWSIELSKEGTFSATHTVDSTSVKGRFVRLPNGFVKQTIEETKGATPVKTGKTVYGFEVPGMAILSQPLAPDDNAMVLTSAIGACPTKKWEGVFTFARWDMSRNDLSKKDQPAFGTFAWDPATQVVTVGQLYNLSDYEKLANFKPFTVSGSCSGGKITLKGEGDRGGMIYITRNDAALYFSNTGKSMIAFPGKSIASIKKLEGAYTGIHYDSAGAPSTQTVGFVFASGKAVGSSLDAETGEGNQKDQWTLKNVKINHPIQGFLTADVSRGNLVQKAACAVHSQGSTLLFCASQAGTDHRSAANFAIQLASPALAKKAN